MKKIISAVCLALVLLMLASCSFIDDVVLPSIGTALESMLDELLETGDAVTDTPTVAVLTTSDDPETPTGEGSSAAPEPTQTGVPCGYLYDYQSMDELLAYADRIRLHVHHWFFSTDLTSYWRGGRISKAKGIIGNAFNICPLMNVNDEGKLIPRRNVRTKRKVIEEIVREMEQHAEGGAGYTGKVRISNSACLEDAKKVKALIESRFPKLDGEVEISDIGTVIGAHTGPGTVALFFIGDLRTR